VAQVIGPHIRARELRQASAELATASIAMLIAIPIETIRLLIENLRKKQVP